MKIKKGENREKYHIKDRKGSREKEEHEDKNGWYTHTYG